MALRDAEIEFPINAGVVCVHDLSYPSPASFDAPRFLCRFPPKWTGVIERSLAHCRFIIVDFVRVI